MENQQKLGCFEDSLNLSKILNFPWKQSEEAKSDHTKIAIETKVFEMVNPSFQKEPWFHITQYLSDSYKKWLLNISPWVLFYLWKVQVLLKLSKKVSHFPSCQ